MEQDIICKGNHLHHKQNFDEIEIKGFLVAELKILE